MPVELTVYLVLGLAVLNAALIGWVLVIVRLRPDGAPGLALALAGRFDSIDRNADGLRRDLLQIDQGLRAEIARGARDGLATAFDKVQEGTNGQAAALGRIQDAISQFGGNVSLALGNLREDVTAKLAASGTDAADGRTMLLRDTTAAIAQARVSIDASLKTFGDQQRERLLQAATAIHETKEAAEAANARTERSLGEQREAVTAQLNQGAAEIAERLGRELGELAERVRTGFDGFSGRLREEQEQLRQKVESKLEEIRTGNETKLEQMRLTVDEKLQSTLEQRLGASFKQVSDSLEQVYRSVGEMQALAAGVGDLKRVLTNVKTRGTWTEIWLETILAEVLAPDQYGRNVEVLPGSNQRVEFALRLPGDDVAPVWLPIDVKFPKEDYERLADAANRGDQEEAERMARAIESHIRASAREIRMKYIQPPYSTDFAVMFLPTEGLFAEVIRRPGLVDALQRECHIMVAGPTTMTTLLTAIRMGFRSLAIQKRSAEVWKVLGAVKHEFSNFGSFIDKISKKLGEAQKVIDDDLGRRRRAMDRSLRAVETLPETEAVALLEYEQTAEEPRAAAE